MKKALALLCIFLFPFPFAHSWAEMEQSIPDWVRGTLFVSMLGSEQPHSGNPFELRQYACLYNFESNSLSTLQIPRDAHLTSDLGGNHLPVVISHATSRSFEAWGWKSQGRWRAFSIASYMDGPDSEWAGSFSEGVTEQGIYLQDGVYHFSKYSAEMAFDAPVQILEIKSPEYCVYALEYGVSEQSALEIQFVCEDAQKKTIYESYPLDYPWGKWVYAISPNGNVAYQDAGSKQVAIILGDQRLWLPETEHTFGLAWRNDRELLLFACTDLRENKCHLLSYDVEQKRMKQVLDFQGAPIFLEDALLCDMDVQPQLDCLAYSSIAHPDADSQARIELISLSDGLRYGWNPYPSDAEVLKEATDVFTGKTVTTTQSYGYAVSEDGVYLFEPSEEATLELAWYAGQH